MSSNSVAVRELSMICRKDVVNPTQTVGDIPGARDAGKDEYDLGQDESLLSRHRVATGVVPSTVISTEATPTMLTTENVSRTSR